MTPLRSFVLASCIAIAMSVSAQEHEAPQPTASVPQTPSDSASRSASEARGPIEGRRTRLALLSPISSKSASGASFMAKMEDPLELDGKPVLPRGTLVEGHLETVPARRPMRRGALRMIFDRVKLPDGTVQAARFELASTESDSAKTDDEGTVHPTLSKKRLAIELGGTALAAKLADDLSEEVLATTAGGARWYGLAASTTFLLLQKGREVRLKPGEIIEVDLLRDGSGLSAGPPAAGPPAH